MEWLGGRHPSYLRSVNPTDTHGFTARVHTSDPFTPDLYLCDNIRSCRKSASSQMRRRSNWMGDAVVGDLMATLRPG